MTASPRTRLERALRSLESAASAELQSLAESRRRGRIGPEEYRGLRHQLLVALRRDLAAPVETPSTPRPDEANPERLQAPSMPPQMPLWKWAAGLAVLLGFAVIIAVIVRR